MASFVVASEDWDSRLSPSKAASRVDDEVVVVVEAGGLIWLEPVEDDALDLPVVDAEGLTVVGVAEKLPVEVELPGVGVPLELPCAVELPVAVPVVAAATPVVAAEAVAEVVAAAEVAVAVYCAVSWRSK